MKVLLIPGHGGSDPGAVNVSTGDREKDFNFNIALELMLQLEASGQEVLISRKDDSYISPSGQLNMIRTFEPDVSLAIHCNASDNASAHGAETIYSNDDDKLLAECIQNAIIEATNLFDRGVKKDVRGLAVLKDHSVPSVLVEMGFISNAEDLAVMRDVPLFATALFTGLEEWAT